jgi:hypothetical protein
VENLIARISRYSYAKWEKTRTEWMAYLTTIKVFEMLWSDSYDEEAFVDALSNNPWWQAWTRDMSDSELEAVLLDRAIGAFKSKSQNA